MEAVTLIDLKPLPQRLNDSDEREIDLSPNQRYASVGKTRSGKTTHAMALAARLVSREYNGWEAWWIDSKHDVKDLASLDEWGFKPERTKRSVFQDRKPQSRKLFIVSDKNEAQDLFDRAYNQHGILLIVDEYTEVVMTQQNPGEALRDVFARGGGLDVGLIGLTQEPVYVPRQLLSQSTHQFLFNVTYPYDRQYLSGLFEDYIQPMQLPVALPEVWGHTRKSDHKHGFYHVAVDYDGEGKYYQNMYQWGKDIGAVQP